MNTSTRSVGHDGGTNAPETWVRGCLPSGKQVRHAPDVVPQRAPQDALNGPRSARFCGFCRLCSAGGTRGHNRPRESNRVHGRAS